MKLSKHRSQADLLRLQHSQLTGFSSSEGHWSLLNSPQLPGQGPITNRKHRRALAAVRRKEQHND